MNTSYIIHQTFNSTAVLNILSSWAWLQYYKEYKIVQYWYYDDWGEMT